METEKLVEVEEKVRKRHWVGQVWSFIRIMNVRLRFIFLMILVGLLVGHWDTLMNYIDRWQRPAQTVEVAQNQETEYFCPMHPNIVRSEPGTCPICGMPLSKRAKTGESHLPPGVLAQVQLTPLKIEMGRIGTSPLEYRLLGREIRTVGILDYDETKRAFISSRVKGRIDQLMVNYVGQQIKKGDPLASIYSPDLMVAQEELLTATRSLSQQTQASEVLKSQTEFLATAARKKLSLLGITDSQIQQIIQRGAPDTHLVVYSPISGIVTEKNVLVGQYVDEGMKIYTIADLSTVWTQAKIFEDQIVGIEKGTAVAVTTTAYPNEVFAGRITFVAYDVDPATRTVSARVQIDNPNYKLKPGMYASAVIRVPVGAVTPVADNPQPISNVETSGLARAYVALADSLAGDKADPEAVDHFVRKITNLPPSVRQEVDNIETLAHTMHGKDLAGQREVFKTLSRQVIDFLSKNPPSGMTVFTFHCPMVNADWIGSVAEVRNPYYGSQMLTCGEKTGQIEPKMTLDTQRFAVGYYCPIYPDRVFDKPQHCPIDQFPLTRAKMEKVLALPESAVIDTGTRKVVYRESGAGTFDMVEVQVGPKAGEFYPVISGLKPGAKVATVGAFLVDAENRLNPAAGVQYFGASNGPQGKGHSHK